MAVSLQQTQVSNPLHMREILEEMHHRRWVEDQPTQQTGAIRLDAIHPLAKVTRPIPVITNQMLPIDDLGRPYATITNAKEIDTRSLARKIAQRYKNIEGRLPFALVFCNAMRFLHMSGKPYVIVDGQCIYCIYEPDTEGDFDVMARG